MGLSVLMVEDEQELQALWMEILESRGHEVVAAGSVGEARAALLARENPFDLALVDWTLPDGTGAEVIALARATSRVGRSVVTSGLGKRLPAGHGADAVLPKPFRVRELLELLERLCPTDP